MPVYKRGKVYNTAAWRRVCTLVRARDGGCVKRFRPDIFGLCRGRLTVQHKIPSRVAPHLALDPRNLMTLCASHHGKEDGGRRYASRASR